MGRTAGAKNKSKQLENFTQEEITEERDKIISQLKEAKESRSRPIEEFLNELDEEMSNNEDDESSSQAIIMLGDKFRILVSRLNKTVQEKIKVKTINKETKEEFESEQWKFRGYYGEIEDAVKAVKRLVTYNKVHNKKFIASISELVDIIKESDKMVEGWFKGTSGF